MARARFSNNGNYEIEVDGALVHQVGTSSVIYWRVSVVKTNISGHRGWGNTGSTGWAEGNPGRIWTNNNLEFNFQDGRLNGTYLFAEGTFAVQHRGDGHAEYTVAGGLTLAGLGTAEVSIGWRSLPRIQTATVPQAPTPVGFADIGMTQIRYFFRGNGDGGSPIREWQALWQDATINGPQHSYISDGATLLGPGLTPGHTYNFWSRGRNDIGWGPWSVVSTARTIAGARVKYQGQTREAVPYVRQNGAWKLAQPYSKIDGIWRKSI